MSSESTTVSVYADVPLWANIVVPMVAVSIFVTVIVLLWRTDKEVPYHTIRRWVSQTPYLNKWLLDKTKVPDVESVSTENNQNCSYTEHSEITETNQSRNKSYGTLSNRQPMIF